jgi:hypothetical protein
VTAFTEATSVRHFNKRLSEILALQQPDQLARRVLDARRDVFAVFDLAFLDPPSQLSKAFLVSLRIIEDEEALDARAGANKVPEKARSEFGFLEIVLRYLAANDDARPEIEEGEDIVGDAASDIVEIHVDAVRACATEIGGQVLARAIIHARVETELRLAIIRLRLGPDRTDGAAALELCDLADDSADRARGRRDDDRFTRLGQPRIPSTISPSWNLAFWEAMTRPTAPPVMTSPSSTGFA